MSTIEEKLAEVVRQSLQNNDKIPYIRDTLRSLYPYNSASPTFLSSLVKPIIQHALENKQLGDEIHTYSTTINEIYECINKKDPFGKGDCVFKNCVAFIQEIIRKFENTLDHLKHPYDFGSIDDEELLKFLAVLTESCALMLRSMKGIGYNFSVKTLWQHVPIIFDCCNILLEAPAFKIIEATTSICNRLIDIDSVNLYNLDIEQLLNNMLELMEYQDIPIHTTTALSSSITLIIDKYPNFKLIAPSETADFTNSIAVKLQQQSRQGQREIAPAEFRAMLNVSCLLLRNYTRTPWLVDILSLINNSDQLGIIKLKATLLSEFTENIDVLNSQSEAMDIDQDLLRPVQQDLNSVIQYNSIIKKLTCKARSIIAELTLLDGGDDRCNQLISQLKDISIYSDNMDISVICQPYMKELVEFAIRLLIVDPGITEKIAYLFGYEIPQFISVYVEYALPFALINDTNNDTLSGIASSLELNVVALCKENAFHILMASLLKSSPDVKALINRRLQQIFKTKDAYNKLAVQNATNLVIKLSMNLGLPELKDQSITALKEMQDMLGGTAMSMSDFMSQFFIGILTMITRFTTEKRNQSAEVHDPHALEALKEVMEILEQRIIDHALHLMTAFRTVNALPDMQLEALGLWQKFISLMDDNGLVTHLNGIINGLLQILPTSDHNVRESVAHAIEDVIIGKASTTSSQFLEIPILPQFEELKNSREHVEATLAAIQTDMGTGRQLVKDMMKIVDRLTDPDELQIISRMKRLSLFLSDNPNLPLPYGILYSKLLYLARKYSSHQDISRLAAVNLGKIGAVNPSLVSVDIIDDKVIVMENFGSNTENREFICGLIANHIFPAYNAINDEKLHQYMHYSIQLLLKCAGFTAVRSMSARNDAAYKRWLNLPSSIQEFLVPFLQSTYESNWIDEEIQYPIFTRAETFREWIQKWYCQMSSGSRASAKPIFRACIPLVMSDIEDITVFLLPYIVLYSILSGTNDEVRFIAEEMLTVLNTYARSDDVSAQGKMNYQSLQVVVSVTEYCRQWLNNIKVGDRRKLAEVERVTRFLELIPDKTMGIAAFNSKTYPQALMHFETHIKNQPIGTFNDVEIMTYLRQIYIHLENHLDLVALLEIYSAILSHDEEIIRFEASGKWQEAEVMYKNKIDDNPTELSSYTDYMNCLKKWGSYENVLYFADKTSANNPKWAPQINSFKIDSAWRIEDWYTLDKAVKLPTDRRPEALVGCILSGMRKKEHLYVSCLIEEGRRSLIESLNSSTTESYRKSYPVIFNLQILQELEDAQAAWESPKPVQSIENLQIRWGHNFKHIASSYQYKHNLIELRKAAFFDIRPKLHTRLQTSKMWLDIAKLSRKAGNRTASLDAIVKAEKIGNVHHHNEKAKWYWAGGHHEDAIRLLKSLNDVANIDPNDALLLTKLYTQDPSAFHKIGIKVENIRGYFARALKTNNKMEKAYHNCSSFYRKQFPRSHPVDATKLKVLLYVVKSSAKALQFGAKYYYSSMSQLLNAWFELAQHHRELSHSSLESISRQSLNNANAIMNTILNNVPPFQFTLFLTRLISHLRIDNNDIAHCLVNIISGVFISYPRSSIWFLMGAKESKAPNVSARVQQIIAKAQETQSNTIIPTIINHTNQLVDALYELSEYKAESPQFDMTQHGALGSLFKLKDLEIHLPIESSLYPSLPEVISERNRQASVFPSNVPCVQKIGKFCTVMKSMQKPKKIYIYGSDGKIYGFLVKAKDDLRKDARTMEFNYMINSFLKKNPESRDSELYIRTYAVIPIGDQWGLIEWIENIQPLKGIVNELWQAQGNQGVQEIGNIMSREKLTIEREKIALFKNIILPLCPPVFHKWFLKKFPEANQWLSSRTRYTKTLAVMSIVGHMLGLGDRHAENILFDETNGDCVHVDLNMLFDMGTGLNVPECVPFRLTRNLVDAMGVSGYRGTFTNTCEITMNVLLRNKEALLGVFQTLANDDFSEGKRPRTSQETAPYMRLLEERFRLERGGQANDQVKSLIRQASHPDNLAQMFIGWAPFV